VPFYQILILAAVQGAAELLPVSSSAHVIVAEKLMGLDPTSPAMVFLLVMLHTGTMFAVIAYFWRSWRNTFFSSGSAFMNFFINAVIATGCTGVIGLGLKKVIEKVFLHGQHGAEVETLFGNTLLIAGALAAAGILIIIAGMAREKHGRSEIKFSQSFAIGIIQGFCLPFRGFSRSGATISMALLTGLPRLKAEQFSFALAVILTPVVIAMEGKRLLEANKAGAHLPIHELMTPGLIGMGVSFVAGLLALLLLSKLLEGGQWKLFGFYCLLAAGAVLFLHFHFGI
jgi:undecaprenyl-diphosphatase